MARDVSGGGANTARLEGATWSDPGAPPADTSAACLAFDGSNAASAPVAGLPALNAPMSVTYWIRPSSLPNNKRTVLALLREATTKVGAQLGQDGTGAGVWFYGDSGAAFLRAGTLRAGSWHLVAYTFDGTTHRLSVGTGPQTAMARVPPAGAPTVLRFATYGSTYERFVGQLDDVRVYDRPLSAAEIQALVPP